MISARQVAEISAQNTLFDLTTVNGLSSFLLCKIEADVICAANRGYASTSEEECVFDGPEIQEVLPQAIKIAREALERGGFRCSFRRRGEKHAFFDSHVIVVQYYVSWQEFRNG